MTTKTKLLLVLFAAVSLPLSWANAAANASFTNPLVGGFLFASPGQTITLNLQLALTGSETLTAVDYFLKESAFPTGGSGQFTITTRYYAGNAPTGTPTSDLPDPSAADPINESLNATVNGNTTDLGSSKPAPGGVNTNFIGGTHFIAGLNLSINGSAPLGTYTIVTTFGSYGAAGSQGAGSHDNIAWDQQASIQIVLQAVPEPATLSLLGLGGLATLGLTVLRARRRI